MLCHYTTPHLHHLPLSDKIPNPGPPSAHPQGDDTRPNEAQSGNAHGSRNARHRNQNRCQGVSRSSYEGKQAEIKDHIYDVGGIRGGNDLFDKTTCEIADFVRSRSSWKLGSSGSIAVWNSPTPMNWKLSSGNSGFVASTRGRPREMKQHDKCSQLSKDNAHPPWWTGSRHPMTGAPSTNNTT